MERVAVLGVAPGIPKTREDERLSALQVKPNGDFAVTLPSPLVETIGEDDAPASFDQIAEIVDAVGDRLDVLMDGGIQRGNHVLKALSVGAKAVGLGRYYLYALAAAGQAGVERALGLMRTEIERDMKLMGCTVIGQLSRDNLRFRGNGE